MELKRIWTAIATTGLLLSGGCSSGASVHEEAISARGGFQDPQRRLVATDEEAYCSAEVLRWRYDEATATLRVADARLMLNCCGQRATSVERVDSVYEVTERDDPDGVEGRCERQCAFDFSIAVQEVPRAEVYVKLLRDVVDQQGGPAVIWRGSLDLARGAGAVVLDDNPAEPGCQDARPVRRRIPTVASK
jgi:hypothetical protein